MITQNSNITTSYQKSSLSISTPELNITDSTINLSYWVTTSDSITMNNTVTLNASRMALRNSDILTSSRVNNIGCASYQNWRTYSTTEITSDDIDIYDSWVRAQIYAASCSHGDGLSEVSVTGENLLINGSTIESLKTSGSGSSSMKIDAINLSLGYYNLTSTDNLFMGISSPLRLAGSFGNVTVGSGEVNLTALSMEKSGIEGSRGLSINVIGQSLSMNESWITNNGVLLVSVPTTKIINSSIDSHATSLGSNISLAIQDSNITTSYQKSSLSISTPELNITDSTINLSYGVTTSNSMTINNTLTFNASRMTLRNSDILTSSRVNNIGCASYQNWRTYSTTEITSDDIDIYDSWVRAQIYAGACNHCDGLSKLRIDAKNLSIDKSHVESLREGSYGSSSMEVNITFLNATDSSFNKKLTFDGNDIAHLTNTTASSIDVTGNSTLHRNWWLNVRVLDNYSNPVYGAKVRVYDNESIKIFDGRSDDEGKAKVLCNEYVERPAEKRYYTPHNLTVIHNTTNSTKVVMDESKEITLGVGIKAVSMIQETPEFASGVLWQNSTKINISQGNSVNISMDFSLNETGKFYLISSLYSEISQRLDRSTRIFYVTDSDISLVLEMDKSIYKPGDNIHVNATVRNMGGNESMSLVVKVNSSEIMSENFTLDPVESITFNTSVLRNTSFLLEGDVLINGTSVVSVNDYIKVEEPDVSVNVTCPEVVGRGNFTLDVLLTNLGDVEASLTVRIEDRNRAVLLQKDQQKLIQEEFSVMGNTTLLVNISGDVNRVIERNVTFGEQVGIEVNSEQVYPVGEAVIPYLIKNSGVIDSEFRLNFSVDGLESSKDVYVLAGENLSSQITFNLSEGNYTLRYKSPLFDGNKSFRVAKSNQLSLNVSLSVGRDNISVVVNVSNIGPNEFFGTLEIDAEFYSQEEELNLSLNETKGFLFVLNSTGVEAKKYNLTLEVLHNGEVLYGIPEEFEIPKPEFVLINLSENLTCGIGEELNLSYGVKNIGDNCGR